MFSTIPGKRFFRRQTRLHITLKHGKPYDDWEINEVATKYHWTLDEAVPFPTQFLTMFGYRHELSVTDE